MKLLMTALAASAFASTAMAADTTVSKIVSTTETYDPWTVWEVSSNAGGSLVSAPAVFFGDEDNYPTIGIPTNWTDNDGFWYATTTFTLPANAIKPTLAIASLYADDRVVVELNGNVIPSASTGIYAPGGGDMLFSDSGTIEAWNFPTTQGAKVDHVTNGFVTGTNTLTLIVNNTGTGINGGLLADGANGTEVGMTARVIYKLPESPADTSKLTHGLR
jgi:hypothetical protein